jgi:hypothetical protein
MIGHLHLRCVHANPHRCNLIAPHRHWPYWWALDDPYAVFMVNLWWPQSRDARGR